MRRAVCSLSLVLFVACAQGEHVVTPGLSTDRGMPDAGMICLNPDGPFQFACMEQEVVQDNFYYTVPTGSRFANWLLLYSACSSDDLWWGAAERGACPLACAPPWTASTAVHYTSAPSGSFANTPTQAMVDIGTRTYVFCAVNVLSDGGTLPMVTAVTTDGGVQEPGFKDQSVCSKLVTLEPAPTNTGSFDTRTCVTLTFQNADCPNAG